MREPITVLHALVCATLLLGGASCAGSSERDVDATLFEAGSEGGPAPIGALDASAHDAAADASPSDAAGLDRARLAQASAPLVQIRPRFTVGPSAPTSDLDAQTAWWPVAGEVDFRTIAEGVDLVLHVDNCRTAYSYPIFIHTGSDCSAIQRDSTPWERGSLRFKALCLGGPGARLFESRAALDPKAWSLGGPAASNLLGRAIAVHDPDTNEPLACGIIDAPEGGVPWAPLRPEQRPSNAVIQQLGGVCGFGINPSLGDAGPACPNADKLSNCLLTHCLTHCLDVCAEHIACVERSPEGVCAADCERSRPCEDCLKLSTACTGSFCAKELGCAPPPTPGGPCTELRECCLRQGPVIEGCLQLLELTEQLSGDLSCLGALSDHDINNNFTYRSPCYPDAGADAGSEP